MTKITDEDILRLAELSNIKITETEVHKFRKEIQSVLGYIDKLGKVDVANLEPTNQVTGLVNATRPDKVRKYQSTEELLKNLPDREGNLIKVKRVLE